MNKPVPFLPDKVIEREADLLLVDFERSRGPVTCPPIPIEDILEKHLKLTLELDDAHERFSVPRQGVDAEPDILGAIYFDDARVVVDESLDPELNPRKEGRYRFTLAHEVGHWQLHRPLFVRDPAQGQLFDGPLRPSIICRSTEAKEPLERQADVYASCLLMPRPLVLAAWHQVFPDGRPRVIRPLTRVDHPFVEVPRITSELALHPWVESDDGVLERLSRPLAELFSVSPIAMRIRVEKLGLLLREVPLQGTLACYW